MSQSSLDNSNREHINISYLLQFEQKFISTMVKDKRDDFMNSIENKSVKMLYIEKQMEKKFVNYYHQAHARFRLTETNKQTRKQIQTQSVKQFLQKSISSMIKNQQFVKQFKQLILSNLSQQNINLSVILNSSSQDKLTCSSPLQSFQKYLSNQIIKIICYFFQRIYNNNLLFSFNLMELLKFYSKYYQVSILTIIYQNNRDVYNQFFENLLEIYIKNTKKQGNLINIRKYNTKINSNNLPLSSLCLLPMSANDLQYISSTNQDSFFNSASKILQLSVSVEDDKDIEQQCRIQMEKCMAILKEKSVFFKYNVKSYTNLANSQNKSFNFEQYLNDNPNLQIFYFFDMISKIYADTINTQILPLQKIVYLFVCIFKNLDMKEKIIILSLSKQLWSYIFNIWSLWIIYNQTLNKEFHVVILKHYTSDPLITSLQQSSYNLSSSLPTLMLPKIFTQFISSTLNFHQSLLSLTVETIVKYQTPTYLQFFNRTYFYIQKIKLSCEQLKITTSTTMIEMKIIKRFFDLLMKLSKSKSEMEEHIQNYLIRDETNFQLKVEAYLNDLLDNITNKKDTEIILSYLSNDIYSQWIERLLKQLQGQLKQLQGQLQQNQPIQLSKQTKHCLTSFIQYSNKYPFFSNNSNFFLQCIFEQFVNHSTIKQKIDDLSQIKQQHKIIYQFLNNKIQFKDNFAVAVGNFFIRQIKCTLNEEADVIGVEHIEKNFLEIYYEMTQQLALQEVTNNHNILLSIFTNEFCKQYALNYVYTIQQQPNNVTLPKIDQLFRQKTDLMSHIRLYTLKNLLNSVNKMAVIKQNFLPNCKWLQQFSQMITGKSFQSLVPPVFQSQQSILLLIQKYRKQQYESIQTFKKILQQSFKSPKSKYEFLTFMLNDIYTRSCSQDHIQQISSTIKSHPAYRNLTNKVQYFLLQCYIKHSITPQIKMPQIENGQIPKRIQQFVNTQLIYANYLNIIIACNKQQCPLIQTFFDPKTFNIPNDYPKYLQERFLICGKQNLSATILNGILERNDMSSGYYNCSSKCDFFYVIGGNGFGCQNPSIRSICPWCGGGLGGVGDQLDRINQGAKKYLITAKGTQLTQVREKIRQKKTLTLKGQTIKLTGYSYSSTSTKILQQIRDNNRLSQTVKLFLSQIIFTFWSFLSSNSLLKKQQLKQIFNTSDIATFQQQTHHLLIQLFNKIGTSNNMPDIQDNVIWHLGLSREIFQFIIEYKSKFITNNNSQRVINDGLVKCINRDVFEQQVSELILSMCSGNQKLSLINKSRRLKAGLNISEQGILKQSGKYTDHLHKYPKIRLIKLVNFSKQPLFKNLIQQYRQIIKKDYQILSYFYEKQQQFEKLILFRKIHELCTKLLKIFNLKISRKDAQKKTIMECLKIVLFASKEEENYQNPNKLQEQVNTMQQYKEQIQGFCQAWNKLRNLKFQLQYDCHNFGRMDQATQQLSIQSPLRNFLPDSRFKGDQKGEMLLAFLKVSSQQYNIICLQLQKLKQSSKNYHQLQLFNLKPLPPTQIQRLTKTLHLSLQQIQAFTDSFSSWAVEYGCNLPYYGIDKIQSLIVQNIIGSHILSQNKQTYDSIAFIGEEVNFISQLRLIQSQKQFNQYGNKQAIEKYVGQIKHYQTDNFMKEVMNIKGSLQIILKYFNLQKKQSQIEKLTVKQFIDKNNIQVYSNIIQKEQMFYDMQLQYLLGVYEFIQLQTIKYSAQSLNDSYKRDKLTFEQDQKIQELIKQLQPPHSIFQTNHSDQPIYLLTTALYRFISRKLSLVQINQTQPIIDHITDASLYPKAFNVEKLQNLECFNSAFNVPLTKMYSLMEKFEFIEKRTRSEALIIAEREKSSMNTYVNNNVSNNKNGGQFIPNQQKTQDVSLPKNSIQSPNKSSQKKNKTKF